MDTGAFSESPRLRPALVVFDCLSFHIHGGCVRFFAPALSAAGSYDSQPKYGGMMITSFVKTWFLCWVPAPRLLSGTRTPRVPAPPFPSRYLTAAAARLPLPIPLPTSPHVAKCCCTHRSVCSATPCSIRCEYWRTTVSMRSLSNMAAIVHYQSTEL